MRGESVIGEEGEWRGDGRELREEEGEKGQTVEKEKRGERGEKVVIDD